MTVPALAGNLPGRQAGMPTTISSSGSKLCLGRALPIDEVDPGGRGRRMAGRRRVLSGMARPSQGSQAAGVPERE
jgi:hypothetical protein